MEDKSNELANNIGVAAQKAFDFIEKIIAGPIIETTGIFTDKIKYLRFRNQVNIIEKAREYLQKKGIQIPNKIPIKDVTTLLEYASFEDKEEMQESWAKLLSNALDPNNKFDACHIFSQVLNQLSVNEIYILNHLYSRSFITSDKDRPYLDRNELIRNSLTEYTTGILLIDNLLRLRLIEEQPPKLIEKNRNTHEYEEFIENKIVNTDCFRLSNFGTEFLNQIN